MQVSLQYHIFLYSLVCAFLYPAYSSYKTLSKRPASETDLERWLMYWSVLGVILATEYVAEWLVRWYVGISSTLNRRRRVNRTLTQHSFSSTSDARKFRVPFYWLIKMMFLLYLALPQTQVGSSVPLNAFFAFGSLIIIPRIHALYYIALHGDRVRHMCTRSISTHS